jgi:hypothetical protein
MLGALLAAGVVPRAVAAIDAHGSVSSGLVSYACQTIVRFAASGASAAAAAAKPQSGLSGALWAAGNADAWAALLASDALIRPFRLLRAADERTSETVLTLFADPATAGTPARRPPSRADACCADDMRLVLARGGVVEPICRALVSFPANCALATAACSLLWDVLDRELDPEAAASNCAAVTARGAEGVVAALRMHVADARLAEAACATLWSLAQGGELALIAVRPSA